MTESLLEQKLEQFLSDIKNSLINRNWYSALSLALTIPDICSSVENPDVRGKSRYIRWIEDNLHKIDLYKFIPASDVYALRCSFLHNGTNDISEQKAQQVIESYKFVYPAEQLQMHLNKAGNVMQLDVAIFSLDMTLAAEQWIDLNKDNTQMNKEATKIMTIENSDNGWANYIIIKN